MKSKTIKVLHDVCGQPILSWVMNTAYALTPDAVGVVVGHESETVAAYLEKEFPKAQHMLQEEQNGTGHAVSVGLAGLEGLSDDSIVVILSGDAPLIRSETLKTLLEKCRKHSMAMVAMPISTQQHYGRVIRDTAGLAEKIIEYKDADASVRNLSEGNAGIYACYAGFLKKALSTLKPTNVQGELYLTDIVAIAHTANGCGVVSAPIEEVTGVNTRMDLAAVTSEAQRRINEKHMQNGVTLINPHSTYIECNVEVGEDSTIYPNVHLRGDTSVGCGTTIDTGVVIQNSKIGNDSWIKAHSVISEASVANGCQVGPMAHLRPLSVMEDGSKVGNFVEIKKTTIKEGAKANHLAYLGDALIGKRANIGAGTITCNYDGFRKHKTVVEEGAFIGSDTQLVAPVTVGRDAYVGSGTTVVKNVPRGALAISRVRQVNKDGWADRFRSAQEKRGKSDK